MGNPTPSAFHVDSSTGIPNSMLASLSRKVAPTTQVHAAQSPALQLPPVLAIDTVSSQVRYRPAGPGYQVPGFVAEVHTEDMHGQGGFVRSSVQPQFVRVNCFVDIVRAPKKNR